MEIGGIKIGNGNPPFIIAEMSCNHGGSLENAKKIIKQAKKAGASAIKTQCYEADTITLKINKTDFIIQDGLWKGQTLWDLYNKACTPFAWHKDLYKVAHDEGICIFSSVFDLTAVDHLEKLGCPAYKIASMEIGDVGLIQHAASTGKPLIISTGMASTQEILDADNASGGEAAFLHCMSEYPGTIETSNLGDIRKLQRLLPGQIVGLSDHSNGSLVPIAATALGASIIEKHFGLLPGVKSEDDEFSMDLAGFTAMVEQVGQTWAALQSQKSKDNSSRQMRRSLYIVQDMKVGELFTPENLKSIRPGYGMAPKMLPMYLGKKARKAYRKGDPLT